MLKIKKQLGAACSVPRGPDLIGQWSRPSSGLTPFPHQIDALAFARRRLKAHRAVYLALDPGLGKTIVACMLAKAVAARRVLYICPPSLSPNVDAEFKKWCPGIRPVIVGDTKLASVAPTAFDLIFVDEAHRFKNEKAQRSRALFAATSTGNVIFLSGTPMPNTRPVELWPILRRYAPDVFGTNFYKYGQKFCGPTKVVIGWKSAGEASGDEAWLSPTREPITRTNFDGFTHRAEFKSRLFSSFMLRQKKELLDLPEKREGLLTVGDDIPPTLGRLEKRVLEAYGEEDLLQGRLAKREGEESLHLSKYLRLLGSEKLRHVYPFLEHLLLETKENVLIFAHHRAVIEGLEQFLTQFKPIVITGATPKARRAKLVADFQAGKTRVGILNIGAAGLGWNLTRADREIFVEFSWRDGDNQQASDRAHRIGRTKPVLVQYVVLKDSFDARRMGIVLNKRHGAV